MRIIFNFSQLTRVEIHEIILSAVQNVETRYLPVELDEGSLLPLEYLEQSSPGISDSVESITIYLETKRDDEQGTNDLMEVGTTSDPSANSAIHPEDCQMNGTDENAGGKNVSYVFFKIQFCSWRL